MIYAGFRLVGGFINNRSEAIDVPTPSLARPQPNAYPTAVLSRPTPIPAPTLEQPSLGGIRPGSTVIVVNTGVPLNGRQEPNLNSPVVAIFAEGAPLQILEGPITADGYIWWKVQGDAGIGWSAAGSLDGATWLQIVQN
jgi:hypothetical protein